MQCHFVASYLPWSLSFLCSDCPEVEVSCSMSSSCSLLNTPLVVSLCWASTSVTFLFLSIQSPLHPLEMGTVRQTTPIHWYSQTLCPVMMIKKGWRCSAVGPDLSRLWRLQVTVQIPNTNASTASEKTEGCHSYACCPAPQGPPAFSGVQGQHFWSSQFPPSWLNIMSLCLSGRQGRLAYSGYDLTLKAHIKLIQNITWEE